MNWIANNWVWVLLGTAVLAYLLRLVQPARRSRGEYTASRQSPMHADNGRQATRDDHAGEAATDMHRRRRHGGCC